MHSAAHPCDIRILTSGGAFLRDTDCYDVLFMDVCLPDGISMDSITRKHDGGVESDHDDRCFHVFVTLNMASARPDQR